MIYFANYTTFLPSGVAKNPTWPSTLAKVYFRQGSLETSVATIVMDYDSEQARIRRMLEKVEREWEVNDENQFLSDSGGEEDHIEVEEFHP